MATLLDDYSPRYVGDLSKPLQHTFTDTSGNVMSLTGVNAANMTFRMRNLSTGLTRSGLGTWTITDVAGGKASYSWHASDVAQEGPHEIQAMVPFPDGNQHFSVKLIDFLTPL
jgi:hypothetical protein